MEAARRASGLLIDGAVSAAAADADLVAMIARAGPFGSGNPEPVIALPAHTVTYAEAVGQAHIRVRLKSADGSSVNAIAFRAAGKLGAALATAAAGKFMPSAHSPSTAGRAKSASSSSSPISRRRAVRGTLTKRSAEAVRGGAERSGLAVAPDAMGLPRTSSVVLKGPTGPRSFFPLES